MYINMKKITLILLIILGISIVSAQLFEGETIVVDGHSIDILPLETITESAPVVLDITDTTARVNFVGTIPLACYLVYGTDTSFGSVTNDPNMNSAAIIDHNPIMLDLEPDTDYVFRMQGVAEDGTLYISDLYNFRTLPAQETDNANLLAPGNGAAIREVSSTFGNQANDGRWGVLNAFDNNPNMEWSSNGNGDDAYFIVDLDGTYHINEIQFRTRQMADGSAITESFTITTDDDETYGPFEADFLEEIRTFEVDFHTSSIRYDVHSSTGGNTGIIDINVYGTKDS